VLLLIRFLIDALTFGLVRNEECECFSLCPYFPLHFIKALSAPSFGAQVLSGQRYRVESVVLLLRAVIHDLAKPNVDNRFRFARGTLLIYLTSKRLQLFSYTLFGLHHQISRKGIAFIRASLFLGM
jgi:hypothetical protein